MLRKISNLVRKITRKKTIEYYSPQMNSLVDIYGKDFVVIGENFTSAPGSIILAHDASTITHSGKLRLERTEIGRDVFLGANAVIMPGVIVGDGAIIGAGSIVTKNVPKGMVVAGNPAKVICSVGTYIEKCEKRDVLYSLTDEIERKRSVREKVTFTDVLLHMKAINDSKNTK